MEESTSIRHHRAIAWLDPEQVELVRAIGDAARLEFVGAGTSVKGRSAEVALALATSPIDDLRAALAGASFEGERGIDLAFVAAPHEFAADASGEASADLETVAACRQRGVAVATLEPLPGSMLAYAQPTAGTPEVSGEERGVERGEAESQPVFMPRLRASRRMRDLGEVLEGFGQARFMRLTATARAGEGSLGARLFDALDSVRWLMGDAEMVHAAYVPSSRGERASARELPTDTLAGLRGTMSLNLQFGSGRAAHVLVSDAWAHWSRSVELLGDMGRAESGVLYAGDDGFQWHGADGALLDASRPAKKKTRGADTGVHAPAAQVIAAQLGELLAGQRLRDPPVDSARVLAMAGTALLSARTGQAESVATVLRMMGIGMG